MIEWSEASGTSGHKKMIKVLGLALYGPLAASTRYRLGQYVTALSDKGVEMEIHYLLGDEYLRRSFNGEPIPWRYLLRSGWQRLGELRTYKQFDLAIVQGELFPFLPPWLERSLLHLPYIYDFDDAFYLKYVTGKLGFLRPVLGQKFDSVMDGAAAITAGSEVLASYARTRNANVELFPTVVNTSRYIPMEQPANPIFTVGWIGSPSTAPFLAGLVEPLSRLGKETPVRLTVIGGKGPSIPNVIVEELDWNEQEEVAQINAFDIGIMPLPDDEWSRGKCAFKLIQYMACAIPVIGSRVGANIDVVSEDCGILASTDEEWLAALRFYRDQPAVGKEMGKAGRRRVQKHYSLHRNAPMLADLIFKTVERFK